MVKNLLILLIISILTGCEKIEFTDNSKKNMIIENDLNYPTTIIKLDSIKISQLKTLFFQKNKYIISSLNPFGFCHGYKYEDGSYDTYPPRGSLRSEKEVINVINNFIKENQAYTGIKNPKEVTFDFIRRSFITNFKGDTLWDAATENQKIDTIEVLNTRIVFHITNSTLIDCQGNWFPNIYIPNEFNYNQEEAISLLLGKVIPNDPYNIGWPDLKIESEHLNRSHTKLFILKIETDDKIELRVSWWIHVPTVSYIFFVDVMTGEVLLEETSICRN